MEARELHALVESAFNDRDLEALVNLYEPDAQMFRDDGSVAEGHASIRENWEGFLSLGGRLAMTRRYAVEAGDVALLSNAWTFEGGGSTFSSITAEVARRDRGGTWRYVIDYPFAVPADGE